MSESPESPGAIGPAAPQLPGNPAEQPWLRLDKRMLLVHPITEVIKFIPVLIASVLLGSNSGNYGWGFITLAAIVAYAVSRWYTTTYRVSPTHVELRTGLLARRRLSVPRSRIRSVDIEADLLHRALGLSVVVVGSGAQADKGEQCKLDALDADLVPALRAALLADASTSSTALPPDAADDPTQRIGEAPGVGEVPDVGAAAGDQGREIGHWQPGWVRYAPLSLTGFALVAPVVGLGFQYGLGEAVFNSDAAHQFEDRAIGLIVVATLALIAAVVVVVSLAACIRYLTTYFGLRVLDDNKTLQVRHGLFTTRQITLDLARFRGATVNEPLLLRLAGAAELEAIMVGENPRQKLLPQAPRAAVEYTLGQLRTSGVAPATTPLHPHGPVAHRRRYTQLLNPIGVVAAAMAAAAIMGVEFSPWWWALPALTALAALPLAEDRYRGLGHAVLPATATKPAWLITRAGSFDRDRDCLEAPGIIGWTVRQSWFQRRSGVGTVIAATAAGKKRYLIIDIPIDQAWQLIEAVTPGQLGPDSTRVDDSGVHPPVDVKHGRAKTSE